MKRLAKISVAVLAGLFLHPRLGADSGPFDGRTFKGRIAYSADGNSITTPSFR
jgi:hypothetical protein